MPRYYALVPAAGSGSRFGAATPKQYLPIAGRPLIHHALASLAEHPLIARVWVVLSRDDEFWSGFDWRDLGPKVETFRCGGATRGDTVRNGIAAAETALADDDWVLVHDAARPCLTRRLLDDLIGVVGDDAVGGLLATPLADTLKRADAEARIAATVAREGLWQAQTPQMFRAGLLRRGLDAAANDMSRITDEASAIEAMGLRPKLVASDTSNFKVTYPADFAMAERILKERILR